MHSTLSGVQLVDGIVELDELLDVTVATGEDQQQSLPDVVAETKMLGGEEEDKIQERKEESHASIAIQVFIPFIIAGYGMVGAGIVLHIVYKWPVFQKVKNLLILVPALLGLKGNLEMTLASRLSTQANLGNMDSTKQKWHMIVGNLALVQCQANVVALLGSFVAIVMGSFDSADSFRLDHAFLVSASSLVTASVASLVLSVVTAAVIVLSKYFKINPDNVATPIAASLGDFTSLGLLAWIGSILFNHMIQGKTMVAPIVISAYILITPFWIWIARKNEYTRDVLYSGWTPVLLAMLISSLGGVILEEMVKQFEELAVFQPVINGVGGNLVAVQASRLSTALHRNAQPGVLDEFSRPLITPIKAFCSSKLHAKTARVLLAMVVPGHIIFIYSIKYFRPDHTTFTILFVFVYLIAALLQVIILLYVAYIMVHWMWKRKIDPDNSAIPYLTALGDLLGIILLGIAFKFLRVIGCDY